MSGGDFDNAFLGYSQVTNIFGYKKPLVEQIYDKNVITFADVKDRKDEKLPQIMMSDLFTAAHEGSLCLL